MIHEAIYRPSPKIGYTLLVYVLVSILISGGLFSQNWAPIILEEKHHFSADGSDQITHTILVDSSGIQGDNEVLYFNRVLELCNTCTAEEYGINEWACPGDSCMWWENGTQFLQRKVIIETDGTWFFSDPYYFKLEPWAPLGADWIFDGIHTAEVTSEYYGDVLGQLDSLKEISVSDGSVFILSKNHGLVSYFTNSYSYELLGLQEEYLGETLPDFYEIFDFEVGDIFEYKFDRFIEAFATTERGIIQKEVIQTQEYSDSIIVEFQVTQQTNWELIYPYPNTDSGVIYYEGIEALTFRKSEWSFIQPIAQYIDSVDRDLYFGYSNLGLENVTAIFEHGFDYGRNVITSGLDWNMSPNLDSLNSGIFLSGSLENYLLGVANTLNSWESIASSIGNYDRHGTFTFAEGLGIVCTHDGDLDWSPDFEWMTGFIKGGDTTGVITPTSVILNSPEFVKDGLRFYPNPTSGIFQLVVPIRDNYELRIQDMHGKVVLRTDVKSIDSPLSIDITSLPSGFYSIHLFNESEYWTSKILKE